MKETIFENIKFSEEYLVIYIKIKNQTEANTLDMIIQTRTAGFYADLTCKFSLYLQLHKQICSIICIYMGFDLTLTQFYINFSRQGHQIELILVAINS